MGAIAQGKVQLANNSARVVYYGDSMQALPVDAGFVADLYAGVASDSLALAGTSTGWSAAGLFNPVNIILPAGLPGGPSDTFKYYFQVQIRPSTYATAAAAAAAGAAFGYSDIFQARASSTPAYNSIVATGSPAFSTWMPGTAAVLGASVPGSMGAIAVIVPEPSSFALAGLGAAALLIFRRRN